MSNSFYGGREGRSFVVVKNFNSIQEMAEAFSQGPAYTEVNFDEYVLINTINKNDPSNGKIFRRGYDFDSNRTYEGILIGGGVYVGTIIGPAGKAPLLSFKKYSKIFKELKIAIIDVANLKTVSEMLNYLKNNFSQGKIKIDENGTISNEGSFITNFANMISTFDNNGELETLNHYFYYDELEDRGWYPIDTPPIIGQDQYTPNEILPGAYYDHDGNIQFNDNIQWGYYSVRNENNEDATAYIGFNFIYPVFEFTSKSIDALETASIKRIDDKEHPFYSKWELVVPKGIKGDAIRNIRVVMESEDLNLEDLDSIDSNGVPTFKVHPIEGNTSGEILVCDYVYYGNSSNGEVHTIYLGDYNVLEKIILSPQGVLNALYTHDGEQYLGKITWIDSASFDQTSGQLKLIFNHPDMKAIEAQLKYIASTEEIEKDNSKYVKFNYCNGDSDEFQFGSYNMTPSIIMSELEAGPDQNHELLNELPNNGIWFVSESIEV